LRLFSLLTCSQSSQFTLYKLPKGLVARQVSYILAIELVQPCNDLIFQVLNEAVVDVDFYKVNTSLALHLPFFQELVQGKLIFVQLFFKRLHTGSADVRGVIIINFLNPRALLDTCLFHPD